MLAAWLLVITGMTTLLVAANRKGKDHRCREVLIGIKGSGEKFYIEKADVLKLIEATANGSLINRPVPAIDLASLERALETNPWIREARLYVDSKDVLHVSVEEREPVARIFTTEGNSFYIDSSGHRMPLLEKMSARLPVVTGFSSAKRFGALDSLLLEDVKRVTVFIYHDPFWNAQIGQIDITGDRKFELVPVIGDHIIKLGSGEGVQDKLARLYIFYKQVMSKVGFNKYACLDLRFDGQVVGVNKGPVSAVDSIRLQNNIQELINRASLQTIDGDMLPEESIENLESDSTTSNTITVRNNPAAEHTNPKPVVLEQSNSHAAREIKPVPPKSNPPKTKTASKPVEKSKPVLKTEKKPKAVMKRN